MNTTRILVLTIGVISAIAITGMQIQVLAVPHPSLDIKAQLEDEIKRQELAEQSEDHCHPQDRQFG